MNIALTVVTTTLLTATAFASAARADSSNVSTVVDFEFGGDVPGRHKGLAAKKPNASRTGASLLIEQGRSGRRHGGAIRARSN